MRLPSLTVCYHAVSSEWDDALAVPVDLVARHLALLVKGRAGGSAADALSGRSGVLHVTFDDAYASVLAAAPVLERLAIPATVFACGDYGDGRPLSVAELSGERYDRAGLTTMTWEELDSLAERGIVIGSHTMTHPHLPELPDHELESELVDSRRRIEDMLGRPCTLLAYPYGDVDRRVRNAARRAGYAAAFGLPGTSGDAFDWPRMGLYRRDGSLRALVKSSASARGAVQRVERRVRRVE